MLVRFAGGPAIQPSAPLCPECKEIIPYLALSLLHIQGLLTGVFHDYTRHG